MSNIALSVATEELFSVTLESKLTNLGKVEDVCIL